MKINKQKRLPHWLAVGSLAVVVAIVLMVVNFWPGVSEEADRHVSYALTPPPQPTGIRFERVIAHAGGVIDGNRSTNSLEAVRQSVAQGYKLIELDFAFSSDGQLVMLHDWTSIGPELFGTAEGYVMSFAEYQKAKILNTYQPLTMASLIQVLEENPGVRIITDVKDENIRALTAIAQQYPAYQHQFIPQIYKLEEYEAVAALGYEDIILTLYRLWQITLPQLRDFALEKGLYAVTMSTEYKDKGWALELQAHGIPVYTHTVNRFEEAEELIGLGFIGVYTDELPPLFWQGYNRQYYLVNTNGDALGERLHYQQNDGSLVLKMKGPPGIGGTVKYFIGEALVAEAKVNQSLHLDLREQEPGKLPLKAAIYSDNGVKLLEQNYYLWNDLNMTQVMVEACEYMLAGWVPIPDFTEAMETVEAKTADILGRSLVASAGSYIYYNNGCSDIYYNGRKLFPAYLDDDGSVVVAFSASCLKLGAEKAYMDDSRLMHIKYKSQIYKTQVGSSLITWEGSGRTMKKSVDLYLGRAVAAGEVLGAIFERTILDQDGILIILPKDVRVTTLTDKQKEQLLAAAASLFPQAEAESFEEDAAESRDQS